MDSNIYSNILQSQILGNESDSMSPYLIGFMAFLAVGAIIGTIVYFLLKCKGEASSCTDNDDCCDDLICYGKICTTNNVESEPNIYCGTWGEENDCPRNYTQKADNILGNSEEECCITPPPSTCEEWNRTRNCPSGTNFIGNDVEGSSFTQCCSIIPRCGRWNVIEDCPEGYTFNGDTTIGSTTGECCSPIPMCNEWIASPNNQCPDGYTINEENTPGNTIEECCSIISGSCYEWLENTNYFGEPLNGQCPDLFGLETPLPSVSAGRQGSSIAECCDNVTCDLWFLGEDYNDGISNGSLEQGCDNSTLTPLPGSTIGYSEEECCRELTCGEWYSTTITSVCDDPTTTPLPDSSIGYSEDECCRELTCGDWGEKYQCGADRFIPESLKATIIDPSIPDYCCQGGVFPSSDFSQSTNNIIFDEARIWGEGFPGDKLACYALDSAYCLGSVVNGEVRGGEDIQLDDWNIDIIDNSFRKVGTNAEGPVNMEGPGKNNCLLPPTCSTTVTGLPETPTGADQITVDLDNYLDDGQTITGRKGRILIYYAPRTYTNREEGGDSLATEVSSNYGNQGFRDDLQIYDMTINGVNINPADEDNDNPLSNYKNWRVSALTREQLDGSDGYRGIYTYNVNDYNNNEIYNEITSPSPGIFDIATLPKKLSSLTNPDGSPEDRDHVDIHKNRWYRNSSGKIPHSNGGVEIGRPYIMYEGTHLPTRPLEEDTEYINPRILVSPEITFESNEASIRFYATHSKVDPNAYHFSYRGLEEVWNGQLKIGVEIID